MTKSAAAVEGGATSPAAATAPVMPAAAAAAAAPEVYARDSLIAWFRGEFTAANAIIDALCGHLAQIGGGDADYEAAFAAINRRRMNWFPVLHMQRFFSIGEVSAELRRVAASRSASAGPEEEEEEAMTLPAADAESSPADEEKSSSSVRVSEETEEYSSGDSSDQKVHPEEINGAAADDGSEEAQAASLECVTICSDHEECMTRPERIKISKGFVAREPVKGHMASECCKGTQGVR
ncbi:uncharacterized protein M6B38_392400 [Iris pallida]|uniref:Uncharacterized protein n=1 Tax=Iris pallida TaxID=29817 RepID=A0AAX6FYG5_IRIPA|nr:uncharacterized protein M6B38_392400 [Iris pallida]